MSTGVIGSAVLLVLAAVFVGLLVQLLRGRSRSAPAEAPRTVGELVNRRAVPDEHRDDALVAPVGPHASAAAPEPRPAPDGAAGPVEHPAPGRAADTLEAPPTGEFGDAPWRRAARMMGAEPGAGWDTAPLPVPPPPAPQSVRPKPRPAPTPVPPDQPTQPVAGDEPVVRTGASARPTPADAATSAPAPVALAPVASAPVASAPLAPAPVASAPAASAPEAAPVAPAPVAPAAPAPVAAIAPAPAGSSRGGADGPAGTDGPSRPLSDPDLTPLMGIPVVRTPADTDARPSPRPTPRGGSGGRPARDAAVPVGERPTVPVALDTAAPRPTAAPGAPAPSGPGPAPAAVEPARTAPVPADPTPTDPRGFAPLRRNSDDDVALVLPVTAAAAPPVVRTGSPEPVWFRVVRRDGEPVPGALVTLLDDHGQEVDATKTATDGGGELQAPHAGRFLMIAGSDGFQPRAVLLTVEGQPVELALLLPRSAGVAGVVRSAERPVTGARVVARQEGEIVDDVVTGRDGAYRFADLAEGGYALSATDHRGDVVRHVTLSEGAEVELDLDLVYRNGGR